MSLSLLVALMAGPEPIYIRASPPAHDGCLEWAVEAHLKTVKVGKETVISRLVIGTVSPGLFGRVRVFGIMKEKKEDQVHDRPGFVRVWGCFLFICYYVPPTYLKVPFMLAKLSLILLDGIAGSNRSITSAWRKCPKLSSPKDKNEAHGNTNLPLKTAVESVTIDDGALTAAC